MDHAAAHERIEDLLLDPARLANLERSMDEADVALREHLDGCPACRADLDGWRRVQAGLAMALPRGSDEPAVARGAVAAVEPLDLPPSLRAGALSAIRNSDAPAAPVSIGEARARARRGRRIAPWVGIAASLVVLIGATVITVDQVGRRTAAERESAALAEVVTAIDAILAENHRIVPLQRPDGSTAGSIAWTRHEWVVLTNALEAPPPGRQYLCWLEDAGRSVPVGEMEFAGGTAYWIATLDDWQTWEIEDTTRFVVTLEAEGATTRTGPAVLEAALSS